MQTSVRPELEIIRTGPSSYVLDHPARGESYEFGEEERFLLQLLREGHPEQDILIAFDARFGSPLGKRRLAEFIGSLKELGLYPAPLVAHAIAVDSVPAADEVETIDSPRRESARALNRCFDALAAVFGPLVHPAMLVPISVSVLLALAAVVQHFDRILFDLDRLANGFAVPLVLLVLIAKLGCRDLIRETMVGIACRRFRGRIRSFKLKFLHGLVPYIQCDVGDSFYFMDERGRWTLLSVRLCTQFALAALAILCWEIASPGSGFGLLCLLVAIPCVVGPIWSANPFAEGDCYYMLSYGLDIPELFERSRAQVRALWDFRYPAESLPLEQRLWFRLYGVGTYAWEWFSYAAVLVLGGGWLMTRFDGVGLLMGLVLWFWWHHEDIWGILASNRFLRWLITGGDHMWLCWTVRASLVAAVVAIGFIPYHYEIAGRCRVIPAVERGIRAQVTDEITLITVSEGDWVEADQLIAEMSGRDVIRELQTTQWQLNQAEAELDLLLAGSRDEEIKMAELQVQLWQTRFEFAENELLRTVLLAEKKTVAEEEVDKSRRSRDVVMDMLASAQENLKKIRQGAREQEIRRQKAKIEELKSNLDYFQKIETLLTLTSPIAGRVSTANLQKRVGQVVQKGDLVAVIQDTSTLLVEMAASEATAVQVHTGMPVKIRLYSENGALRTGTVQSISVATTTRSEFDVPGTDSDREIRFEKTADRNQPPDYVVRVVVQLDGAPTDLVPGMTGYARIVVENDILALAAFRHVVRFARTDVWSWMP